MIIERDGKFYKQTIIEEEIDPVQETYKLQAWKDAITNDERESQEYQAKIAEIDALELKQEHKEALKMNVPFYSGSGIRTEQVKEVEDLLKDVQVLSKK